MRFRLLALTAVATLAAAAPAASDGRQRPRRARRGCDGDIEWAGVSRHFVSGTGWLYTHTIKTPRRAVRRAVGSGITIKASRRRDAVSRLLPAPGLRPGWRPR